MMDFTHLHVHSEFSFDGLAKVEQLLAAARDQGMRHLALTDHHSVFGWFQLAKYAQDYGVQPIYGIELNVGTHHLTAVALNETGLENLLILNNEGYKNGSKPKITEHMLAAHTEGIFVLSGCMKGKIQELLRHNRLVAASDEIKRYQEWFPDRYALEVQQYGRSEQAERTRELLRLLAMSKQLPLVPTNDVHYVSYRDHFHYQSWVKIQTNGKLVPHNTQNYFKTEEELYQWFTREELASTAPIANQASADFFTYIKKQTGTRELPTAMIYYYDDAESLRRVLYGRKEYKLGEYMKKKMKVEGMTLEDLPAYGKLAADIAFAKAIRGKVMSIEPDPYYYIRVSDHFPVFRKNKKGEYFAQVDCLTAQQLGLQVEDRRKLATYG